MAMEKTKQEIAQEEKSWSEETAREKEAEVRRRTRYGEFTQDKQKVQQTLAAQEDKLKETLAKMEAHQLQERELQARFKQMSQVLVGRAKGLRGAMAAGLPYRLDKRLEGLDLLVRDLEGGNISPEEGMNRLWAIHQTEKRLAQEAEVYSGDFTGDAGDPIQVKYLRVGKQMLAFSSLDGTRLGVLKPGTGNAYAWVREKDLDHAARQAIKNAIATAEGKSVPGFVPLPVWPASFPTASLAESKEGAAP